MVRRDYELLTNVLKGRRENATLWYGINGTQSEQDVAVGAIDDLVDFLASELAQDNKAFDSARFVKDIRGEA